MRPEFVRKYEAMSLCRSPRAIIPLTIAASFAVRRDWYFFTQILLRLEVE
jgi:hypothetical protein